MKRLSASIALTLALSMPGAAGAILAPIGPEFQVNTYTTHDQISHWQSVCRDAAGDFVVVWERWLPSLDVFARRFDSGGIAQGPEFQVNSGTPPGAYKAKVCCADDGDFVVVWRGMDIPSSSSGIFGRRFDSTGAMLGVEFIVNSYTTQNQSWPSLACDPTGSFVAVWESDGQDGSAEGVFGQLFDSAGAAVGSEFQANTYTTGDQSGRKMGLSMDDDGNFVVTWTGWDQDGDESGIFAQRYDSTASKVGSEFLVNTYTTDEQSNSSLDFDASGNFVVIWDSYNRDGNWAGVFGRRFDSTGAPVGNEFRANDYTLGAQWPRAVAVDDDGSFAVIWTDSHREGSSYSVWGRRYRSDGTKDGSEFMLNTYTTSRQSARAAATDGAGNFVVVWGSYTQDGDRAGVFARLFEVQECGNGVMEGTEECDDGNAVSGDCCSATCTLDSEGAFCTDYDACTENTTCDVSGDCVGGNAVDCNDGNLCTDDSCDSELGCLNEANTDPCDDGLTCTDPDTCADELCVGNWDPIACSLDHFKLYKAKTKARTQKFASREVELQDQFQTRDTTVLKPAYLGNPANKNTEGINVSEIHHECYKIKDVRGQAKFPGWRVGTINQFGSETLDLKKAKLLCVPSLKDEASSPGELPIHQVDHFKCYKGKTARETPKFEQRTVTVEDQFELKNTLVIKPAMVCNPASKNSEGISNVDDHLECYKIKDVKGQTKFASTDVFVRNQFGAEELTVIKAALLCVPSSKTDLGQLR